MVFLLFSPIRHTVPYAARAERNGDALPTLRITGARVELRFIVGRAPTTDTPAPAFYMHTRNNTRSRSTRSYTREKPSGSSSVCTAHPTSSHLDRGQTMHHARAESRRFPQCTSTGDNVLLQRTMPRSSNCSCLQSLRHAPAIWRSSSQQILQRETHHHRAGRHRPAHA